MLRHTSKFTSGTSATSATSAASAASYRNNHTHNHNHTDIETNTGKTHHDKPAVATAITRRKSRNSSPTATTTSMGFPSLLSRLLGVGIYTVVIVQVMLAFIVEKQQKPTPQTAPQQQQQQQRDLESSSSANHLSSSSSSNTPITSFMCINGQLERLELDNKIETVLNPIKEQIGGTIDIALIVTENKAIYTKAKVSDQRAQHEPQFTHYHEAVDYLTSKGFNVVSTGPVDHAKDPNVYQEYLWRLAQLAGDKKINDPAFFAYDKKRAQNHVRQAISGELCYRHMVGTGADYSKGIVTRWRDDVGFLNELPIGKFHKWLQNPPPVDPEYDLAIVKKNQHRPTMITPYCRNWQGLNDRGAFVHPGGAYAYFMAPMVSFTKARPLPKDRVCNHERFLRDTYNKEGFLFVPTKDLYPVPMFRNDGKGVFREEEKDNTLCRVWWKSYRPDCPRQDEKIKLLDGTPATVAWEEQPQQQAAPVAESKPQAAAAADDEIRSFVCINGQLERLELDNKLENLLIPIREEIGGTVDIALVVSENQALYTKVKVSDQRAKHKAKFDYYYEAVDYLTKQGFNVVSKEPSPHSADPMVFPEYEIRLAQLANDKNIKTAYLFERNHKRAQNHVRQAISGESCYRHMMETGHDYSKGIVSRWRDDVGFEHKLDVATFHGWIHDPPPIKPEQDLAEKKAFRPTMITPYCRNWNGLNDRGAFIHPGGAYEYFMAPLMVFSAAMPLPSKRICNFERFLRWTYNREGFYYIPTRQLYPVPMYTVNGTGVFREEELKLMCLSFWNSYNVDCPRNNETITILRE